MGAVSATASTSATDGLAAKRARQQLDLTWALVRDELADRLRRSPAVAEIRDEVRAAVLAGELPATTAADQILAAYDETTEGVCRSAQRSQCPGRTPGELTSTCDVQRTH